MTTHSKQNPILSNPSFHPVSIARILWQRKSAIVAAWLALTAGAAYVVHGLPNVYRAEALILVDSQKIPEKFVASTVEVSLQETMNAINKRVLSSGRLEEIISEFDLYSLERRTRSFENVLGLMRNDLKVTLEKNLTGSRGGACRISFEGSSPTVVTQVVDRVTDIFVNENVKTRQQRAEGASTFIEQRLAEAKTSLDKQEANLSSYKVRWAGELPQQEDALLGALRMLQEELDGEQQALNRAEQNRVMLETTLSFSESALGAAERAKETSAKPAAEMPVQAPPPPASEALRHELDQLRLRYFDDHREVKRVREALEQALQREAAAPRVAAGRPAAPGALNLAPVDLAQERQRVVNTKTQLELIDKETAERTANRKRILESIADYQSRVNRLPLREAQIAALTRDYDASKANYRSLLDKKISAEMSTEMEKGNQSEQFSVADRARIPIEPVKPRRRMLNAIACLLALAFSLSCALLLGLTKNQFLGEWELPANTVILGRISRMEISPVTGSGN